MEVKPVILLMLPNLDGVQMDVRLLVKQIMEVEVDDEDLVDEVHDQEVDDEVQIVDDRMCVEMEYCKDQIVMEIMNSVILVR
jgi:hypothetical protein